MYQNSIRVDWFLIAWPALVGGALVGFLYLALALLAVGSYGLVIVAHLLARLD
jgi:hypothetical protein